MMRPRPLIFAALMLLIAEGWGNDANGGQAAATNWVSQHSIRWDVSAGSAPAALREIVGSARVVGFGEASHGAHEFLIARNQIFRYLVEEMGFTAIIAETHPAHAELSDDYVQGRGELSDDYVQGRGELTRDVVDGVFAANRTFRWSDRPFEENRELIEWMREYNAHAETRPRIHIYGMDLRHPFPGSAQAKEPSSANSDDVMAGYVRRILDRAGPEARAFVFAHNGHLQVQGRTLGQRLRQAYGEGFRLIGSVYGGGRLNDGGGRTVTLPASEPGSVNQMMEMTGLDCFAIDLHPAQSFPKNRSWLDGEQRLRASYWQGRSHYDALRPRDAFDALLFIRTLSPIRDGPP